MTKKDLQDLYGLLTQFKNERLDEYAEKGYNVIAMNPKKLYKLDNKDMLLSCADGVLGIIEDKLG